MREHSFLHPFVRRGGFAADGVPLARLLRQCKTPFYLYSASAIRSKYRLVKRHFRGFDVFYSFKANPSLAVAELLHRLGACADVSSLGEVKAALRAGFGPKDILFVGPGKTAEEIAFAVKQRIAAVVAESAYELTLIEEAARGLGRPAAVMLRINTNEEPSAPEIMVGGPSKFGFDEERVVDEVKRVRLKFARLAGVHVYAASQVLDAGLIAGHMDYVAGLALRLSRELAFPLECVDFGGGFGVPYSESERELDLPRVARAARRAAERLTAAHPRCRLALELGRFLVAESGVFVTRVLRVKRSRGRNFIITDAGINHLTRTVFMRANHPVRILNKIAAEPQGRYDVAGPVCTPIDTLAHSVSLPRPEVGDVVGVFNAGAYGFTMSMLNFMSLGWPAEILADRGRAYVIRRARPAETFFADQTLPRS